MPNILAIAIKQICSAGKCLEEAGEEKKDETENKIKKQVKLPEESRRGGRAGTFAPRERMSDGLLFTVRCVEEASLQLSKVN